MIGGTGNYPTNVNKKRQTRRLHVFQIAIVPGGMGNRGE
jgi:hypothetical protein